MTKKGILGLTLALALLVAGTSVMAHGPGGRTGFGFGGHMGYGYHQGVFGTDDKFLKETAGLRAELDRKSAELNAVLAAPEVDEDKAKALQGEINKIRNELARKQLAAELEFKKNNPDVKPGYNAGGRHMGWGGGPGACWR